MYRSIIKFWNHFSYFTFFIYYAFHKSKWTYKNWTRTLV